MRKIALSSALAIVAGALLTLSLSSAPVHAAPPPAHPATLLQASDYLTVSCGATEVEGPCMADCFWTYGPCLWQMYEGEPVCLTTAGAYIPAEQWENQTHLYAWPIITTVLTTTAPLSASVQFVDLSTEPCECSAYCDGHGYLAAVADYAVTFGWDSSVCPPNGFNEWGRFHYTITTTGVVSEMVVRVSQSNATYYVTDWYDRDPVKWPRPVVSGYTHTEEHLGGGVWRYTNYDPEEDPFDNVYFLDVGLNPMDATTFEAGLVWEILSVNGVTITAGGTRCTIRQWINLDSGPFGLAAIEIDRLDYQPLGLYPFAHGVWQWPLPLDEVMLEYELQPLERVVPKVGGGTEITLTWPDVEKHIVKWMPFTLSLPFIPPGLPGGGAEVGDPIEVPECIPPTRPSDDCPPPRWYDVGGWTQWLWCNTKAWYTYFDNSWRYYVCIVQATIATAINATIFTLKNIYTNVGTQLYELAYMLADYYSAWSTWVHTNWQGFVNWLHEGRIWSMQWYEANSIEIGQFAEMAVTEFSAWLGAVLNWIGVDVVQGVIDAAAEIINRASSLTDLLATEFNRAMTDAVSMITFIIKAVMWLVNLGGDLVLGFREMMNDDLEADLFTSFAPAFWSGLVLFEDIAGSTPIGVLNTVALGMVFFGIIWWTIGQIKGLMVDLSRV